MQTLDSREDKCGGNFNKSNTFIKTSTSHAAVGESNKQGVKLEETKASRQHYAKGKLIKPKHTLIQGLYIQTENERVYVQLLWKKCTRKDKVQKTIIS